MTLQRQIVPTITGIPENKAKYKAALRMAIMNYRKRILAYVTGSPKIPEASGNLKASAMEVVGKSKVIGTEFEAWFGFGAEYTEFVEKGRPPGHFPPVAEIEVWCITSGLFPVEAATSIAWGIYKRGIAPQMFFAEAFRQAKAILREEFSRAFLAFKLQVRVTIT